YLQKVWKQWRSALVIVRPETVLDWQRKRFKRYWCQLSQHKNPGRPRRGADIRKLVKTMAEANPSWGCTKNSRRTAQARNRGFRTYCVSTDAPAAHSAVPDLANLFGQSRSRSGLSGLLHSADSPTARVVCVHCVVARTTPGDSL